MKSPTETVSKVFSFISVAVVAAFCVFAANDYYQRHQYAQSLVPKLNITVFIEKGCADDALVCDAVTATGLVTLNEYVSSEAAFAEAVEKNPFLKDISVPGDNDVFQSYMNLTASKLPTEDFLVQVRKQLSAVENVQEIVFNPENFKEYVKTIKILNFHKKIFTAFAVIIALLVIVQSTLFVSRNERNSKKLIMNSVSFILASSFGFLCVWSLCLFLQYPLLIDEKAAFFIIPVTAAFGIIFNNE